MTGMWDKSKGNEALIMPHAALDAMAVDQDHIEEVTTTVCTYTLLPSPGLCQPRFLRLPSDEEKQAAYWSLEAKYTQIHKDNLRHISYVIRMKFRTLDYVCSQVDIAEMLDTDRDGLKRYCDQVRKEHRTLEDRVDKLLVLLKKPFDRNRMTTIKSRVTQMLEEEKLTAGIYEDAGGEVGGAMLGKELYTLFRIIARSRVEVSRMTEDLIKSILAAMASYEWESATWIEVFDNITKDGLNN